MSENQHLHDFHNYSANVDSREIFLHNFYGSNDEENPGVEYRMSVNFIKNLRALDLANSDILIHMYSVGSEWTAVWLATTRLRCADLRSRL